MAALSSTRAGKSALIGEVKTRFDKMTSAVFLNYKGMTVESATKLRASFRKAGVEYKVVKNTVDVRDGFLKLVEFENENFRICILAHVISSESACSDDLQ